MMFPPSGKMMEQMCSGDLWAQVGQQREESWTRWVFTPQGQVGRAESSGTEDGHEIVP